MIKLTVAAALSAAAVSSVSASNASRHGAEPRSEVVASITDPAASSARIIVSGGWRIVAEPSLLAVSPLVLKDDPGLDRHLQSLVAESQYSSALMANVSWRGTAERGDPE